MGVYRHGLGPGRVHAPHIKTSEDGQRQKPPPPQAFFQQQDAEVRTRPASLAEPLGPQPRERHVAEQVHDAPVAPILDAPVPQMVEQLVDVLKIIERSLPVVAEQVIDVPKMNLQDRIPQRSVLSSWWNSWWKCQQSLISSSRPLTFQFRVVLGLRLPSKTN